jgi:Flp pilus assembly protein TadG
MFWRIQMALSSVANLLRRLRADERGAVSTTMGIMMIPLVGFLALGYEVSNWYLITRSMQNASDAAALAAAINNSANYDVEARAVATQYGFTNGVNNVTIGVSNTATCPATGNKNCYSVTINGYTPLLMSQVVGFQGAGNINGSLQKQLSALAVAQSAQQNQPLCLLALASSGTSPAINTNGAPTGNMNGCDSMSNTAASCSGHNLGLDISFANGSNTGCGNQQVHNDPIPGPLLHPDLREYFQISRQSLWQLPAGVEARQQLYSGCEQSAVWTHNPDWQYDWQCLYILVRRY